MNTSFFGKDGFTWWKGVVEDRKDPLFLGRVRVRIFGWHTEDKIELPTEDLPWATPSLPIDNGRNPVGLKEGDWCWGFFLDGEEAQFPVVVGFIPGIDEEKANPEIGFYDPTPDDQLTPENVPRPPDMSPVGSVSATSSSSTAGAKAAAATAPKGRYSNSTRLPGQNVAFGQLTSEYDAKAYKFDINKDGTYNQTDASLMRDINKDGTADNESNLFFSGTPDQIVNGGAGNGADGSISRYPLETRLMEPTTSRLARNENVEDTIVEHKRADIGAGESAGFAGAGVGGSKSVPAEAFQEPETPYNAKYPYNHVYESESGHILEVDDSPGAERLHWYHRAGTFREIHPEGDQVNKVVKSEYNFIYKDFFNATKGSISMDAGASMHIKSNENTNVNAGEDLNQQAGSNMNTLVRENMNTRVKKNTHTLVGEESWTQVKGGTYLYVKEGVLHVIAQKDILFRSLTGAIELASPISISLTSPKLFVQGDLGGGTKVSIRNDGPIRANEQQFLARVGRVPPPDNAPILINKAFDSSWISANNESQEEDESDSSSTSPKYGFLFPNGRVGDVYKPISESDKKLVILSADGGLGQKIELCEALPTGELESVKIVYEQIDGSKTTWEVVRPKHVPGDVIATSGPRPTEQFEDGVRFLYRFNKAGAQYPKQLFWRIVGQPDEKARLVLDSSHRHQCKGSFDDKIVFDLNKTKK